MSTINDIAKMEEELAALRLASKTNQHMLSMQDFELRSLRNDNAKLRGRIEAELMRGRELDTLLRTLSAGLVSGLAIYAKGREAVAAARQGAAEPEAQAETAPETEPASRPSVAAPAEAVEHHAPRTVLDPPLTPLDVLAGLPARSIPRQVVQRPLEDRLATAADGIGRPHRTPMPGGPGFVDDGEPIPKFLRTAR